MRDIHDLRRLYPTDASLQDWATAVHALFADAVPYASADARARVQAHQGYAQRLGAVCQPFVADPVAVQGRLCRRIQRHLSALFVFVAHPEVPADTNAAERSLRHLVTIRTISGGTRAPAGTDTKMTNATLFGTWRARGLNPFTEAHHLLLSPHL